jgi:hypothetical protein
MTWFRIQKLCIDSSAGQYNRRSLIPPLFRGSTLEKSCPVLAAPHSRPLTRTPLT